MTTYPKMDPEIKEDWVEALRSGEFVQGHDRLDWDDAQCCLGVLCDILDIPWQASELLGAREYDGDASTLARSVAVAAGIDKRAECFLIRLNDDFKVTFDQIADWIEAHL